MAGRPVRYEVAAGGSPLWASEPFRVFFPLGLAAGIVGLLLWPLHFAGWWSIYPALQHPRMLIFGFGAAFVYGFLGTAWPRFLEAKALRRWEVFCLVLAWTGSQIAYGMGEIARGDAAAFTGGLFFLGVLGFRLLGKGREWPPPGFSLAFLAVAMGVATLFLWARGIGRDEVAFQHGLRLVAYQGFSFCRFWGWVRILCAPVRGPGEAPRQGPPPRPRGLACGGTGAGLLRRRGLAFGALGKRPSVGGLFVLGQGSLAGDLEGKALEPVLGRFGWESG